MIIIPVLIIVIGIPLAVLIGLVAVLKDQPRCIGYVNPRKNRKRNKS